MSIFKGLYNNLSKSKVVDTDHSVAISAAHTAEMLLNQEKRQKALRNIKALLNLPPKLYDNLYFAVIENFAEYVQNIPETQYGLYSQEGGFLEHGLERASRALSLCLANFFPEEKSFQSVNSQQALWIYAVFTAALLMDVGLLAFKYKIDICEKTGKKIKEWSPFGENLNDSGNYYQYDYVRGNREQLRRLSTPLLAKQLLDRHRESSNSGSPATRFNWLASDNDVLEAWLMILNGDHRGVHSFMTVIPLAEAQVLEAQLKNKNFNAANQHANFMKSENQNANDENFHNKEAGEAFLQWLQNGIKNGSISVNKNNSDVHIVAEGVLINLSLFTAFSNANSQFNNPVNVQEQFRHLIELNFLTPGDLGQRYTLVGGISAINLEKFFLITNVSLLFGLGQVTPLNSLIVKRPLTQQNNNTLLVTPNKEKPYVNLLPR